MATRMAGPASASLPPFPEGWYYVAQRKELEKAGLIQKTWVGENIIAWSDEEGRACVAEALCPHLGSDLGPDAGGGVREGRLVCPFHGFEFDTSGQCVATPFAPPPRSARLRVFETQEVAGLIFAWWSVAGGAPPWRLPETPEQEGWSDIVLWTLRFRGHPQEATENSVDLAHLRYIHGYESVERGGPVEVEGPLLVSRFEFRTVRRIARFLRLAFDISATAEIWGLGCSQVKVRERSLGMDMRMWVLPTPVDGEFLDMTVASQVRELRKPKRSIVGLRFLPTGLRAPILNRFMSLQQKHDVLQDEIIWSRKRFLGQPRLNRSDGEIATYRNYCAQFYPDAGAEAAPRSSPADRGALPEAMAEALPEVAVGRGN